MVELRSFQEQVNKVSIWTRLRASFGSLCRVWVSKHILRFPIFQTISNFPDDIFSFLRDNEVKKKKELHREDNSGYLFRAISGPFPFLWRNEFQ